MDSVTVPHATQHADINDAMEAVQAKLGTGAGTIGDWSTYTPTATAGAGTITSYSAIGDYTQINDVVIVEFSVTLTNNGTASGNIRLSLPVTPTSAVGNLCIGFGFENAISGFMCQVALETGQAVIRKYDYSYPGGTGRRLVGTFIYKAA